MKHKNNLKLILLAIFAMTIFSCENEPYAFEKTSQAENKDDEFTVLGEKKEIPFTVENMQKAYENLLQNPTASRHPKDNQYLKTSNSRFTGNYQINTTHYYVKFHPQDSLQYEKITNDSILSVSDVPFEYDINTEGARYQDPELSGTDFTYYYSVAPVNYQLPSDVPYETLANLHFTKEDLIDENAPELELQKVDFFHDLNTEALKTTNNLEEEKEELRYLFTNAQGAEELLTWQEAENKGLNLNELIINFNEDEYPEANFFERRRKWSPSGTITVQEDAINQSVGVMGARVRVRKWGWLVIRRATTNRNGYFQTSRTRTKRVKYACYFKHRPEFIVKAGTWFWNARDRGHAKHKRTSWRRHYTYGRRQLYAFVQNAAFDYYTRIVYDYSIKKPKYHMKISAKYNLCASSQHRAAVLSLLPISRIRITRKGKSCTYRGSDGIYATTIHELTHAGHQKLDSGMFSIFHSGSENRDLLTESWAEGVESIVTNDRYDLLTGNNYQSTQQRDVDFGVNRWNGWRQRVIALKMNQYTPIVEDLFDTFNQHTENSAYPQDNVENYTLDQIENALDNCRDINCWENNLNSNRPSGVTTAELNQLFDYVHEVRNNSSNWD